jgi:hypothetical protein
MSDDQWNLVGRSGKVIAKTQSQFTVSSSPDNLIKPFAPKTAKKMIANKLQILRDSQFIKDLQFSILQEFSNLVEICPQNSSTKKIAFVCYGIGNIFKSEISQYQCGLLQLLVEWFSIKIKEFDPLLKLEPEIFDPVLTLAEQTYLQSIGISLIAQNEMCSRRLLDSWGIFYMPHCEKFMYCNLIQANLDGPLSRILLIGNSFERYNGNTLSKKARKQINPILSIIPNSTEIPFPIFPNDASAFNDMCILRFFPKINVNNKEILS